MNFKKLLSTIGMLTVIVPTSLTVVACGSDKSNSKIDNEIINDITQETLKINDLDDASINSLNQEKNIINLLNDSNNGLINAIQKNSKTPKEFNPKLFSLDINNIYYDKDKTKQVKPNDSIKDNVTDALFFEFSYDGVKDKKLVEVDLSLNMSDKQLVAIVKQKLERNQWFNIKC